MVRYYYYRVQICKQFFCVSCHCRHSVSVERATVDTPPRPTDSSTPSGTSNTDNADKPAGSVDTEGGVASTSGTSSMDATVQNHVKEVPVVEKPKFFFTPVNRFGNTEGSQLEDKGTRFSMQRY